MAPPASGPAVRRGRTADFARIAGGVRWDRITRWALLALVAVLLLLYVNPLRSYFATSDRAAVEKAKVEQLRSEHTRLLARRKALQSPGAVEVEARRQGYVKPGEKAFVVTGLSGDGR